jgi:hypothetical protein
MKKAKNYISEMEATLKNRVPIPKEQLHYHPSAGHLQQGHGHGILHLQGHQKDQTQMHMEKYREMPVEDRQVEVNAKPVKITVGRTM